MDDVLKDLEAAILARQDERAARDKLREVVGHVLARVSQAAIMAGMGAEVKIENGPDWLRVLPDGRVQVFVPAREFGEKPAVVEQLVASDEANRDVMRAAVSRVMLVGISRALPLLARKLRENCESKRRDTADALNEALEQEGR